MFLIKKLRSVLVAGLFFAISTANAQVIYTKVDSTITTFAGIADYNVDLNKDGTADFIVRFYTLENQDASVPGGYYVDSDITIISPDPDNLNPIASQSGDAISLSSGQTIDNSLEWNSLVSFNLFHHTQYGAYNPSRPSYSTGNFINSTGKYVGVQFMEGANTYYGYIGIDTKTDDPYSCTVRGFAYDSTPDKAITAGAGEPVAGIDSYIKTNTSIKNINNTIVADFKNSFNGQMQVVNVNGQVIKTTFVSGYSASVSMEGAPTGIYQVIVTGAEGFVCEKIFIAAN